MEAGESELARDLTYTHYYKVWSNLVVTAIIPITVLVFCNFSIFLQLRKSRKEMVASRQSSNNAHNLNNDDHSNSNGGNNSSQSPDYSLAMILAGIVIVFVFCHSFRFFLAFYQVSTVEKTTSCIEKGKKAAHPSWLYVISALNHLMLMVNSSINFIIYCAVGSRFRQALALRLFGWRPPVHGRGHETGRLHGNATTGHNFGNTQVIINERTRTPEVMMIKLQRMDAMEESSSVVEEAEKDSPLLSASDTPRIQTLAGLYTSHKQSSPDSSSSSSSSGRSRSRSGITKTKILKTCSATITDL